MVIKTRSIKTNIIEEGTITKQLTTSLSKDNPNSIENDTYENQDDLNYLEIFEIGEIKDSNKIGKLSNDN